MHVLIHLHSSIFDISSRFDPIKLTSIDDVQRAIIGDEERDNPRKKPLVHLILFGCMWCYPSYITLKHAHDLFFSKKPKQKSDTKADRNDHEDIDKSSLTEEAN
eukprot:1329315-Amorphochlora_amoeboformis.AAC.2